MHSICADGVTTYKNIQSKLCRTSFRCPTIIFPFKSLTQTHTHTHTSEVPSRFGVENTFSQVWCASFIGTVAYRTTSEVSIMNSFINWAQRISSHASAELKATGQINKTANLRRKFSRIRKISTRFSILKLNTTFSSISYDLFCYLNKKTFFYHTNEWSWACVEAHN